MAITWTPSSFTLIDVTKPNSTIFDISASSDDVDSASVVYTVLIEDFPDTSFIAVDGSGVHITGDTSQEFQDNIFILYMENGVTASSTKEPDDLNVGDDVYSWNADATLSKDVTITIRAQFLNVGLTVVESEDQTYTLTIYNSWDAHKASVQSLMTRLY